MSMGYDDGSGDSGLGGGSMGFITSILQRLGTGLGKVVKSPNHRHGFAIPGSKLGGFGLGGQPCGRN
jgi:hypothetical protein